MFFGTSTFDDFSDFFRSLEGVPARRNGSTGLFPAVESFSREGTLVLRAELPGVAQDAVDVTVEDGRLILRGEKKAETEEDGTDFHMRETRYGRFERRFTLPDGVNTDGIRGKLENGVLEVTLPLEEPEKARRIEIAAGPSTH